MGFPGTGCPKGRRLLGVTGLGEQGSSGIHAQRVFWELRGPGQPPSPGWTCYTAVVFSLLASHFSVPFLPRPSFLPSPLSLFILVALLSKLLLPPSCLPHPDTAGAGVGSRRQEAQRIRQDDPDPGPGHRLRGPQASGRQHCPTAQDSLGKSLLQQAALL